MHHFGTEHAARERRDELLEEARRRRLAREIGSAARDGGLSRWLALRLMGLGGYRARGVQETA